MIFEFAAPSFVIILKFLYEKSIVVMLSKDTV